ncbi:MAG: MBL fold metallo-hydrolase [Phycisphaerae bacterium]|nr:MBL fold metallo-hydrolase [Phycisphaerae bacterium]
MRFLFLGTGTSAGVPAIGCDCPVCTSTDPRDQRLRTAAALRWTDRAGSPRTVLLDAGPDLRLQSLRARLDRCDAVLFTHNHVDHTFGLDEVRRFNAVMHAPIDIYADPHTMDHLRRVYKHIFDRDNNVNDSFVATLIPHLIDPHSPIDLHGLRFTPIPLLHGKLPVLGFRIEPQHPDANGSLFPLAYCTDVSGIPPQSWPLLRGLRTLVLDALRHRHHPTHLSLAQAVGIAHQVGAPRTYFVHMAHDLPHAQTNRDLPEGMALAHDGLELAND